MQILRLAVIFVILNTNGCVLYDYYQQDCAISTDYFQHLPREEQVRLEKKCGGAPQMRQVLPHNAQSRDKYNEKPY